MSNLFCNLLDLKYSESLWSKICKVLFLPILFLKKKNNIKTNQITKTTTTAKCISIFDGQACVVLHLNSKVLNDTIKLVLSFILANNELYFKGKIWRVEKAFVCHYVKQQASVKNAKGCQDLF